VNFSGEEATVDLSGSGIGDFSDLEILLSSYDDTAGPGTGSQTLRPYEAVIARVK